jgi:hypothetical protein
MVRRTRNGRTGQIFGDVGKTCPPQAKPAGVSSVRGFKQWEILFDAELNNPDKPATLMAWRTLTGHHCDPHALKSSLFYAAGHLKDAQEVPQAWEAFGGALETTLNQVARLKNVLRELMLLRTRGRQVASDMLLAWEVKKKDVSFLQGFPGLLERFESVLKVLVLPSARRDTFQDWMIASGESLLHIYVQEITGKLFSEETAVLLEASAASCGLDRVREFSEEAVSRRYRRFRRHNAIDYIEMTMVVSRISRPGDTFLKRFLDARKVMLAPLIRFRRIVARKQFLPR